MVKVKWLRVVWLRVSAKMALVTKKVCPVATQNIEVNLKNRNIAFADFGYGPPDPSAKNTEFWKLKVEMYKAPLSEIKNMKCGNCAAFIQTPRMMECIISGLEKDEGKNELSFDEQFVAAADLGYCDLFQFTCAAARTCDAWKAGGPITKD
jgi:hypothetical protein